MKEINEIYIFGRDKDSPVQNNFQDTMLLNLRAWAVHDFRNFVRMKYLDGVDISEKDFLKDCRFNIDMDGVIKVFWKDIDLLYGHKKRTIQWVADRVAYFMIEDVNEKRQNVDIDYPLIEKDWIEGYLYGKGEE